MQHHVYSWILWNKIYRYERVLINSEVSKDQSDDKTKIYVLVF